MEPKEDEFLSVLESRATVVYLGGMAFFHTTRPLNLRARPSTTGDVLAVLPEGALVECIGISPNGHWLKVRSDFGEGWSTQKYLLLDSEPAEEFEWLLFAIAEQGVQEFVGDADNPRIVEYLQTTSLGVPANENDETAWCSAFVNWCVENAGIKGSGSAWARSWLKWGQRIDTPRRGCIVVFSRGESHGHVGFCVGESDTMIQVLGGNQEFEAVNVRSYEKSRLLGYRVPG